MTDWRRRALTLGFHAATLAGPVALLAGCGLIVRQATIVYIKVNAHFSPKEIAIEIDRSFVERYKNRVTIATNFTVDKAMSSPLPVELDGDIHFSGRAPEVLLPIVAEIANAASHEPVADVVRAAAGGRPLKLAGVWRIWPEHPGDAIEKQGVPLAPLESINPDHVFEIHPVTRIGRLGLLDTFTPVKGFKPGGAERTFKIYENATCAIEVKPTAISIITQTGIYNDVEFIMEIADDHPLVVADGRFVTAKARDMSGDFMAEPIRMVFAKGTPPERSVAPLHRGDRLHVYGMPRLDLAEISRRVQRSGADPAELTRPLPYEIVILGVYPTNK